MIADKNIIDFSGLKAASWLGLISLDRFLQDAQKQYILTNIPAAIYQYLKLLPNVFDNYTIDKFELIYFEKDSFNSCMDPFVTNPMTLKDLNEKSSSSILNISENSMLETFTQRYIPDFFSKIIDTPKYHNDWFRANVDEVLFWSNLMDFWISTIGLSQDMVCSQRIGLNLLLQRIIVRVKQTEQAFSRVGKVSFDLSSTLIDIKTWIEESSVKIQEILSSVLETCRRTKRKIIVSGENTYPVSRIVFVGHLNDFKSSILSLERHLENIEKISFTAGRNLVKLGVVGKLKQALMRIDGSNLNEETIESIRNDFHILDPFSDGSWLDTREEIENEFRSIKNDVGNTIVLFQSFDLLRQVLEHRIHELKIFENNLDKIQEDSCAWASLKVEFYDCIRRGLVTDQEKHSFNFYLTDAATDSEQELHSPGEVLLF